jgi:hypothetical protein
LVNDDVIIAVVRFFLVFFDGFSCCSMFTLVLCRRLLFGVQTVV